MATILQWFNVATLGVVVVVAVLFVNTMSWDTKWCLRWGFILTAAGSLGEILTWLELWRTKDIPYTYLTSCLQNGGLACLALALSRGHSAEFIAAIHRRFDQAWDGIERRKLEHD